MTKPKFILKSIKTPGIKFEILSYNKETGVMKLRGAWSEFEEIMTKEAMAKYGYEIVKETEK